MLNKAWALGASISVSLASVAGAQTVPASVTPAAPVAAIVSGPSDNILRAGAAVPLRFTEALTTEQKQLRVGQRVQLETVENVIHNGMTVIPAGSPAVGEVVDVRNKGMWGKSGRIGGRLLYVRVGGRQIRLSGAFDDKGVTGTAGVVAAIAFIPVAGFFVTGTSARIAAGSQVKAFLDEDLTVATAVAAAPTAPAAPIVPAASLVPVSVTPVISTQR